MQVDYDYSSSFLFQLFPVQLSNRLGDGQYLQFLQNDLLPLWFMHDGCPAHSSNEVSAYNIW